MNMVNAFSTSTTEFKTTEGSTTVRTITGEVYRKGGPKEARLNRVRLMETGRYFEAAVARGEKPNDPEHFHSLRVDNLPLLTT